jgi:hypothetical protein
VELTILGALLVIGALFLYALVVALTGLFFTLMEEPEDETPEDRTAK